MTLVDSIDCTRCGQGIPGDTPDRLCGTCTDDTCPECGEPAPTNHRDRDGIGYWDCCGQEVRCPSCREVLICGYHDEVGAYCRHCKYALEDGPR